MNYNEFLSLIYQKRGGDRKINLNRIRSFLDAICNPEQKLRAIHIAGTNGKGSSSAVIESILFANGYNVGLNTSPHLVDFTERFRINKNEVSEQEILCHYLRYKQFYDKYDTTFFEIATGLAFTIFYEKGVDYAIMETGMGGRLDATNLVNSVITVITNIDYEHTKSLGNTLSKIANEKAGIIKKGVPLVLGIMRRSAQNTIIQRAKEAKIQYYLMEKEVKIENVKYTETGSSFSMQIQRFNLTFNKLYINLAGTYQIFNCALAVFTIVILFSLYGQKPDEMAIREGLLSIKWSGRLQLIRNQPKVVIDGAHNPDGINALVSSIKSIYSYRKLIVLIGILGDKNIRKMVARLSIVADEFVISTPHSDRAADLSKLEQIVKMTHKPYHIADNVIEGYKRALDLATDKDMICITGSLYTVGEILAYIKHHDF
ncbi:MAG: hypothetical protein DRH57_02105 [Candidatus Cloacimonadota bacterium]|nr:MAG: hypothetical protein DRH57_02105 [Candidatus Cloacimonadota bacterium]